MRALYLLPAALLLGGCLNDTASLRLGANDHALTLQARQPYFWSQAVELEAVMSRQPDCHRRSRLDKVTLSEVTVDVFRPEAGEYAEPILILRQGANAYAVSTANCELQKFKAPPAKPGTRLGTFQREGEKKLKYVAAPLAPAAPASAATPASPPPAASQ
ncbi:MAG: hypothetical protein JNL78_03200 [Rhodocyclaceae bacterium]|jgi:hypothetical protein|nr:hypothetical protein [Rhodocyclaceae bacterium]